MCIRDRVYHDHEVGGCYFTMSTPKTAAGKRAIPILPEVRKALEQERTNQQELELVCEYEIDGISDFVFLNRFGQPQNPQTVNRAIKRISVCLLYTSRIRPAPDSPVRWPQCRHHLPQ